MTRLLAALFSLSLASAASAEVIYRLSDAGPPTPLARLEAEPGGAALVLRWPDGAAIALERDGAFFVASFPDGTSSADESPLSVSHGAAFARIASDRLVLVQAADSRWVLADADTEPSAIPPEPHSIRVPADASAGDDASASDAAPESAGEDAGEQRVAELNRAALMLATTASRPSGDDPADEASPAMRAVLESPETLNAILEDFLGEDHGIAFLRGVDWKLVSFEANGETSLGIELDYEKSQELRVKDSASGKGVYGLGFDAEVSANVAFERSANPKDFLDVRLGLDYFRSHGGTRAGVLSEAQQRRAVELATASSNYTDARMWLDSPEWNELKALARSVFTAQVYWDVGLDAGFESDQSFSETNFTVGAHAALDVKAWDDSSALALANFVDYPAAALRMLTGYDKALRPRGNALPTFVLHLDHVEPDGETPRTLAGDSSAYRRLRGEIVYKAPVGRLRGDDYYLLAQFRAYYEIDARRAIRAADLDYYDYLSVSIESDEGPFITYSTGRQPFDDGDADVYALGWKLSF